MSCRPQNLDEIDTEYLGVPVKVKGVTFYPYVPSTNIDPAEQPMVEWDCVFVGGVDVSDWFKGAAGKDLDDILIQRLEG